MALQGTRRHISHRKNGKSKGKSSTQTKTLLVGGFNPIEKYSSKWESSPNRDANKKYLTPPPSLGGDIWELVPRYRYQNIPQSATVENLTLKKKTKICKFGHQLWEKLKPSPRLFMLGWRDGCHLVQGLLAGPPTVSVSIWNPSEECEKIEYGKNQPPMSHSKISCPDNS